MFGEAFRSTVSGVLQICILGAAGYVLVKKNVFGQEGLNTLSRLVVEVTLPVLIFSQLITDFKFNAFPEWWIFPLMSMAITMLGLVLGLLFSGFVKGGKQRMQFLSLIAFQNSGYLPLALVAAVLPPEKAGPMFIYLFMFLLGFNLVVWSFGVYMLSLHERKRFEMGGLFSPPVISTLLSLGIIFLGANRFIPDAVLKPLKMIGVCTVPLAMFVVGGSLALIHVKHADKKAMASMILVKLIIMPLIGLWLVTQFRFPEFIGLMIIMQLAVPPATSLSVIIRHYKKEDLLISQGIFWGHIVSLITIPFFLSIYFSLGVIK
jgi:predicted permease